MGPTDVMMATLEYLVGELESVMNQENGTDTLQYVKVMKLNILDGLLYFGQSKPLQII